jgi:hypothetical protein
MALTDKQKAVRGFMMQSSVSQFKIMEKHGFTTYNHNISIIKNQVLFVRYLKDNNKSQEFIDECKLLYEN